MNKGARWKLAGAVIAAAVAVLLALFFPVGQWAEQFVDWIQGAGAAGKVLFVLAYVAGTVLCLWGSAFTVASGLAFGLAWGIGLSLVSATVGAAAAFLIARHLARGAVERYVGARPKLRALDRAVGEKGWKLVFLLRLNPVIPFNLSNYFYGITAVRFWPHLGATFVAMIPGTVLYTYLGVIGRVSLTGERGENGVNYTLLTGGLVFTGLLTVYFARMARHAMRDAAVVEGAAVDEQAGGERTI